MTLTGDERSLLMRLLATPTAGPLETGAAGPAPRLWEAQRDYARAAGRLGFRVVRHAPADPADLEAPGVPETVREAAADPGFLACQPSLVLRLGPDAVPRERTVMFNVHMDTVAGGPAASFDGEVFRGRGAVDAKGPAVALLAGVRTALERSPALGRDTAVLVQAVAGEEGGAMGVLGTRPLVGLGHTGRVNVFCEPTSGRFLTRSTASMTARVSVRGDDAVDDRPHSGHNASVLLGFLAQRMGRALDAHARNGAVCVAGLHTGRGARLAGRRTRLHLRRHLDGGRPGHLHRRAGTGRPGRRRRARRRRARPPPRPRRVRRHGGPSPDRLHRRHRRRIVTTLSPESPPAQERATVTVDHDALLAFLTEVFAGRGLPRGRAAEAARALCHGDLSGMDSHGVANLAGLYLPLLEEGRA
ncbi:M20/M25/M40 family metallo-hydrolase, partial [Nocardiopsis tropica]|nr:M20/M25/M40 family metallo-hydrolase [Nocardiopsis tropica]